jgi:hypothetical protein
MKTVIACKNVVKVRFDGNPDVPSEVNSGDITDIMRAQQEQLKSEAANPKEPELVRASFHNATDESKHTAASRLPRNKQLQSLTLLLEQHNQNCTADDCAVLYLIDSEWMNAWYRCVASNDMSLYPGPITNWGLIEGYGNNALLELSGDAVSALVLRAKQARGLSFDGEELDFADEELEELQNKHGLAPVGPTSFDYTTCRFPVKAGLREDVDFYLLPGEAWQALHGWYGGGPPLPRVLQHSFKLRTTAPCRGAHELLRLPSSAVNDAEPAGVVLHELDLYAPYPEQLPCVQEADRLQRSLPTAQLRRGDDAFCSSGSLAGGLSAMPSMAELSLSSPPASVVSANGDSGQDGSQLSEQSSQSGRRAAGNARCHVCQRAASMRCSKCSSIFYCSRDCQALHWRFHRGMCAKICKRRAIADPQQHALPLPRKHTVHDRGGKVGLANLGNSCYMNSSLQCLSHVKPLTLAFLSQRALKELNLESRDGSGGKLAEQYTKLMQELWFEAARAR